MTRRPVPVASVVRIVSVAVAPRARWIRRRSAASVRTVAKRVGGAEAHAAATGQQRVGDRPGRRSGHGRAGWRRRGGARRHGVSDGGAIGAGSPSGGGVTGGGSAGGAALTVMLRGGAWPTLPAASAWLTSAT